jgi:transposase
MKAYSLDLREKVVERYQVGGISQRELAKQFGVSLFFVEKILKLKRTGGSLAARPSGSRMKPKLDERMRMFIKAELEQTNDLTLEELCERVAGRFAVRVSAPTMCRTVRSLGLRRKKRVSTPASGKVKE